MFSAERERVREESEARDPAICGGRSTGGDWCLCFVGLVWLLTSHDVVQLQEKNGGENETSNLPRGCRASRMKQVGSRVALTLLRLRQNLGKGSAGSLRLHVSRRVLVGFSRS